MGCPEKTENNQSVRKFEKCEALNVRPTDSGFSVTGDIRPESGEMRRSDLEIFRRVKDWGVTVANLWKSIAANAGGVLLCQKIFSKNLLQRKGPLL